VAYAPSSLNCRLGVTRRASIGSSWKPTIRSTASSGSYRRPYSSQLHGLLGQREAELSHYRAAAALLEASIRATPDDARFHGSLASRTPGSAGRRRRAGRKAGDGAHARRQGGVRGALRAEEMVRIYAMVASATRRRATRVPDVIPLDLAALGLRLDPTWDSLRDTALPEARRPLTRRAGAVAPAARSLSQGLTVLAPAARWVFVRVTTAASMAAAEAAMRHRSPAAAGRARPIPGDAPRPGHLSVMATIRPRSAPEVVIEQARSRAFLRPPAAARCLSGSHQREHAEVEVSSRCSASHAATAFEGVAWSTPTRRRCRAGTSQAHAPAGVASRAKSSGRRAGANGRRTRGGCRGPGEPR